METISRAAARRLAIHRQGLNTRWKLPAGEEGAAQVVDRLGYVQIDTISVIERAHHHVMGTRQGGYQPGMLYELLADRQVFEYWTHAAAYVPFSDYRYYVSRMRSYRDPKRAEEFRKAHPLLLKKVLQRIESEGALSASDFEHKSSDRGPWWDWTPAKRALEFLFDRGELMVTARDNFRRVYDLTERVVPSGIDTREPGQDEVARHFTRRALAVHGVATVAEVRKMFGNRGAKSALAEMVIAGEAIEVRVTGDEEVSYALPEVLATLPGRLSNGVHLLSPFDNLTIDRNRLERLFDFRYRIECYTPQAKRRYGYFTLPILWKGMLVGRLDPKAERRKKLFLVRNLVLEPSFHWDDAFASALAKSLREFATFNGCPELRVEKTAPRSFKNVLKSAL
jgi:hypothetical protein